METQSDNAMTRWTAAECSFAIDYSSRILDDIRLAVTDAFFSLPRGGAEIGGILLGRQEKGRIVALDALPIACEHAFGPSFVLSPRDHEKLAELLAVAGRHPHNKVVGWYHSHTRSEIFLSAEDLEIHHRFFPEPWQVALVLKPHTFQPMRAAFFFREKDGTIHSAAPYREFLVEPLPMRPAPANGAPEPTPLFRNPRDAEPDGPVINVAGVVELESKAPEPEPVPAPDLPAPAFLAATTPPPSRRWMTWALAALLGTALGAWGWHTRAEWLPDAQAMASAKTDEKLGLSSVDHDGQLQVQWNGTSRAALASTSASLLIVDGDQTHTVELGRPHVLTGSFTYARKTGKVDVTMVLPQPGGNEIREATIFAGDPPGPRQTAAEPPAAAPAPAPPAGTNAADLAAEIARLRQDNAVQVERNKRLEKAMEELRKVIQRDEQRKRLELQSRDSAK